jgi:hypothetical protein
MNFNYYNEEILNLISDNILNIHVNELKSIYDIFNNEGIKKIDVGRTNHNYQQFLIDNDISAIQFDLPYFFDNKKEKTIMIIGMDAKASHPKDVVLSTPYYLQSSVGKNTNNNYYWDIIKILSQYYNIYLTDVYKAYYKQADKESNEIPEYTLQDFHQKILKDEIINIVKPFAILSWGKDSRDFVANIFGLKMNNSITKDNIHIPYTIDNSIKFISTPHPSRRTRLHNWEKFFENNIPQHDPKDNTNRPKHLAELIIESFKNKNI